MSEPMAFLHGQLLPQAQAHLTLHDAGFVMGATVTDLCRTFRHQLYRWEEHLARFERNCRATEIVPPLAGKEITARAQELAAHNATLLQPDQELALVLFTTPGPIGYYLGEEGGAGAGAVTFGMHTFPLPFARLRSLVERGASLWVPKILQVPQECIDPHIKQRSRLHWWLADREVQRHDPGSMALLQDQHGRVTETAAANLLIVQKGVIISPLRESILEGISLGVVRELAAQAGIGFEEKPLTLADCLAAEEVLLTNTSYCLVGVSRLQGKPMNFPGPVFRELLRLWNDQVGLDIHGQIRNMG